MKNGVEVEGAKPIAVDGSEYKAYFGDVETDKLLLQYLGSADIASNMQKYNKDFFRKYTSTNKNMKAVAYMLDTNTWKPFATSSKNYAEYAVGGPPIELLLTAYNKYTQGTANPTSYESEAASDIGYQVRKTSNNSFVNYIDHAIIEDTKTIDNPYSVSSLTSQANAYWLASPSNGDLKSLMIVDASYNLVTFGLEFSGGHKNAFRPLVLIDSNYTLEKIKDSNGNDAFKIVEK